MRPGVDDLVVALAVRDEAARVCLLEARHLLIGVPENLGLLVRDLHVVDADADATHRGVPEAEVLEVVEERRRRAESGLVEAIEDQISQLLLAEGAVLEPEFDRDDRIEEHTTRGRPHPGAIRFSGLLSDPVPDRALERHPLMRERHLDLGKR